MTTKSMLCRAVAQTTMMMMTVLQWHGWLPAPFKYSGMDYNDNTWGG
jgi:hypothetical protein